MTDFGNEPYIAALHFVEIITTKKKIKWPKHFSYETKNSLLDSVIVVLEKNEDYENCEKVSKLRRKLKMERVV